MINLHHIRHLSLIALLLTLFVVSLNNHAFCQQPSYTILGAEALEGVDIYSIVQDQDYNYWIGSDEGLYKHDGYTFELVEIEEMRSVSAFNLTCLPSGNVLFNNLNQQVFIIRKGKLELFFEIPDAGNDISLEWLSEDEIYLSTSKVVYILNKRGQIKHQFIPKIPTYIGEPLKLNKGTIISYVGNEKGMLVYRDGSFSEYKTKGLQPEQVPAFVFIRPGKQLYAIDQKNKSLFEVDQRDWNFREAGNLNWDKNNHRLRLYKAQDHLWVANLLNGIHTFSAEQAPTFHSELWFKDYFISYVYQDQEGNVLLGTFDQGILVVPSIQVPDVLDNTATQQVTRLSPDGKGNLYIGTKQGSILKQNKILETIIEQGPKSIETLVYWPREQLLLTDNSYVDFKTSVQDGKAMGLGSLKDFVDADGHLVAAFNFGIAELEFDTDLRKFRPLHTAHSGRSYALAFDSSQHIWYASTAQGLLYSKNLKSFQPLKYKGDIVTVGRLFCHNKHCYAFSRQHGFLQIRGKQVEQATPLLFRGKKVLVSKFVRYKNLWVLATNLGLLSLNDQGKLELFFQPLNNKQSRRLIDFCIIGDTLWLANTRGLQRVDLKLLRREIQAPKLILRNMKLNGNRVSNKQNVFYYDQRNFTFQFFVPTLSKRESIHYHYRLKGAEEDWNISPYERYEARYFSLSPGSYELEVKAENNGVFSPVKRYRFEIAPPFYKSWWFISSLILIVLFSIFLFYQRKLNAQRIKAKQVNELNSSRLTAIQSQMNPHFIFNALNSIQDLVLKGDINNSYTFITKFSNLVRRTLNYSDKDFIEFDQEIKLLELYLSLEKLRFKEELHYSIDTDGVEDILIPPMLIQPFIENALVHGLLHKDGEKRLSIRFHMDGDLLLCIVEDNGVGRQRAKAIKERQGSQHESFALNAIKKRFEILKSYFHQDLGYHYEDLPQGTRVTLRIPVKHQF